MQIDNIVDDEGAIEGTIEAHKLHDIEHTEGVDDVRIVFSYLADYPAGRSPKYR